MDVHDNLQFYTQLPDNHEFFQAKALLIHDYIDGGPL